MADFRYLEQVAPGGMLPARPTAAAPAAIPQTSMLNNPLLLFGLNLLAQNQARPYAQGPNNLGAMLGRSGLATNQSLAAQKSAKAKADLRAQNLQRQIARDKATNSYQRATLAATQLDRIARAKDRAEDNALARDRHEATVANQEAGRALQERGLSLQSARLNLARDRANELNPLPGAPGLFTSKGKVFDADGNTVSAEGVKAYKKQLVSSRVAPRS